MFTSVVLQEKCQFWCAPVSVATLTVLIVNSAIVGSPLTYLYCRTCCQLKASRPSSASTWKMWVYVPFGIFDKMSRQNILHLTNKTWFTPYQPDDMPRCTCCWHWHCGTLGLCSHYDMLVNRQYIWVCTQLCRQRREVETKQFIFLRLYCSPFATGRRFCPTSRFGEITYYFM